jgi:voltage-gated potassium channel
MQNPKASPSSKSEIRDYLHEVIFEADTPAGKAFDVALLILIIVSLLIVMLDSIESVRKDYGQFLLISEWVVTGLFTIEYFLRIWSIRKPFAYMVSFFGLVDLLSFLPTYLSLLFAGSQYFLVLRILRLLRVFRIFKLTHYLYEGRVLVTALKASRVKITVFLGAVLSVVTILGSVMYVLEAGQDSGFTSIPQSIYWSIVTVTTVGYGDIAPVTVPGKVLASIAMILGYAIIAVPTGIVSVEFAKATGKWKVSGQACRDCGKEGHDQDASHCKFCGAEL